MKRPLKEHYIMPTDYGDTLAIYNYLEDLEKYADKLEEYLDRLEAKGIYLI